MRVAAGSGSLECHGLGAAAASITPGRQVAIDVATEEEEIDVVGHGGHRADRKWRRPGRRSTPGWEFQPAVFPEKYAAYGGMCSPIPDR